MVGPKHAERSNKGNKTTRLVLKLLASHTAANCSANKPQVCTTGTGDGNVVVMTVLNI